MLKRPLREQAGPCPLGLVRTMGAWTSEPAACCVRAGTHQMLVIVSYDVDTTDAAGRRRRIAKTCQDNAARTVLGFQCEVPPADWVKLRTRVIEQVYRAKDSLSF